MNLLYDLIEEIDNYQDKSLFFQDPRVIEGWLLLAGDIKEIEIEDAPESGEKWELRSEPFAATLLARRDLFSNYKKLYHLYYDPLYNLWMNYSGMDWDCVSADAKEALKANQYLQGQKDVEDLNEYIDQLNSRSNDARYALYKTLTGLFDILQAIMNKAGQVVIDLKPSDEDFAKAIKDDLRGMTRSYGKSLFGDMKEDLTRHYKEHRTDRYTPELWSEMLDADEKALSLAKRKQLADCDTTKQEHWGEDMKKQMDENSELMQLIYSSCRTDELFDLRMVDDIQRFISLLNSDNLSIFYGIIVRRNLIQCEMFPELKKQHEEWLHPSEVEPEESDDIEIQIKTKECDNTKQHKLNITSPRIVLQQLLQQDWFDNVCVDIKQYNKEWRDILVSNLMASEYGVYIARLWEHQDKIQTIKAKFIGTLILAGVLKNNKLAASRAILGIDKNTRDKDEKKEANTFAKYMGQGKSEPYVEWIIDYVAKSKR